MHFDYVTFIIPALFLFIGAGLFRVGLHLKGESPQGARRAWLLSHSVLSSVLPPC
jgi:hypothetical protein